MSPRRAKARARRRPTQLSARRWRALMASAPAIDRDFERDLERLRAGVASPRPARLP